MPESTLLNELVAVAAERTPDAPALTYGTATLRYGELDAAVRGFASGLMGLGLARGERVAIYLEKRFETVVASFGAPAAGGVFVPLNPLLKPEQVGFILRRAELAAPELGDLLSLDDAGFRQVFSGSPIKRIGRNRMVRNAAIAAGNSGAAELVPVLQGLLGDVDPVVVEALDTQEFVTLVQFVPSDTYLAAEAAEEYYLVQADPLVFTLDHGQDRTELQVEQVIQQVLQTQTVVHKVQAVADGALLEVLLHQVQQVLEAKQ